MLAVLAVALCGWGSVAGVARAAAPGTISTIAGNGTYGYAGDGGPATSAEFKGTYGAVSDAGGNLLMADRDNSVVRMLAGSNCSSKCPYGLTSMTKGDVYSVAGTGKAGYSSGPARNAELSYPISVALDSQGDLFIVDSGNNVVRFVPSASCAFACPYGLKSTVEDDIYTIAGDQIAGYSGDGGPAVSAELDVPEQLLVDQAGNLIISDAQNDRVRMVAAYECPSDCAYGLHATVPDGIYTIAGTGKVGYTGDGGPATAATLNRPNGLAFDALGDLLIADAYNGVRLLAETSCAYDCQYGLRSMIPGHIYTVAGTGAYGFNGDGKPATSTETYVADAVAVDAIGDLLIADTGNQRIRIVPDVGCSTHCAFGDPLHWEGKGFMYTVAGNGTTGFNGDDGPATSAELNNPSGVDIDNGGNLIISDTSNERIREVAVGDQPPVCYEIAEREVGKDGFTGDFDQEDVVVYAPAGLRSITDQTFLAPRQGQMTQPQFSPGYKGPAIVTAMKSDQSIGMSAYFKATDMEGRYNFCGIYIPGP